MGNVLPVIVLIAMTLSTSIGRTEEGESADSGAIRVLLTYGGHPFDEKSFFAMADSLKGMHYTKALMPDSAPLLKPGLEKTYDVLVMYDMSRKLSPEQEAAFIALLHRGIGLVSLHHNMGSYREWDEFAKIIGGKYCFGVPEVVDAKLRFVSTEIDGKKYGPTRTLRDQVLPVAVADKDHPITRGLADFTIQDEAYSSYYVAPDVHVLLTANHPNNDSKIAWVKEYGKSRVFFCQLGHDAKAWNNPVYPDILTRSIRWVARR